MMPRDFSHEWSSTIVDSIVATSYEENEIYNTRVFNYINLFIFTLVHVTHL